MRIVRAGKADLSFVRLDGDPVGCAGIERYGEHVLLRSLAVARRFRNRGIGAALLDA